ncbi:hypothetical protein IE81DRAFT_349492 [Ceraceosorus guamensis]|uniref:Uncharacterized protein n=1 Tax=Ceraceosorus guamensis TaxID=1522189 RepID=A0A316VT07_9BASI|nr:hypothetical protein IE81DRAFT_349492 [Ceraceosorus guamensis]PWN40168.1 hypothetical protein IE81DRAFT_349492 [Ceraceosorus guamensis]
MFIQRTNDILFKLLGVDQTPTQDWQHCCQTFDFLFKSFGSPGDCSCLVEVAKEAKEEGEEKDKKDTNDDEEEDDDDDDEEEE